MGSICLGKMVELGQKERRSSMASPSPLSTPARAVQKNCCKLLCGFSAFDIKHCSVSSNGFIYLLWSKSFGINERTPQTFLSYTCAPRLEILTPKCKKVPIYQKTHYYKHVQYVF